MVTGRGPGVWVRADFVPKGVLPISDYVSIKSAAPVSSTDVLRPHVCEPDHSQCAMTLSDLEAVRLYHSPAKKVIATYHRLTKCEI